MEMWTVKEIKAGDRVVAGWYLRGRGTQRWFGVAEGWNCDDVQLLADRRNAREKEPRFVAAAGAGGLTWDVVDTYRHATAARFYDPSAEQNAKEHAAKLNKEHGQ